MPRTWTPEQKARQAEAIRKWKPWEKSTGPKTERGKAKTRMNAVTEGLYTEEWRILREGLAQAAKFRRGIFLYSAAEERLKKLREKKSLGERTIKDSVQNKELKTEQ